MAASPADVPALSVVVAAWNGAATLRRCLASLHRQAGVRGRVEVVVARCFDAAADALAEPPGIVDLRLPEKTRAPSLRAAGLVRSRAPVVAFIEDHCTCEPGWAAALLRAHAEGHTAVGGPVEQADGAGRLDWAVYFYDYGRYMPPCEAGAVAQLSGLNMSFARPVLDETLGRQPGAVFEAEVQSEMRRRGHGLWLEPAAVVEHGAHRPAREAVSQAYGLARGYASRRLAGHSRARRAAYAAASAVLPVVLAARIVAGVLHKRRRRVALLLALPWLAILLLAWSAGEASGYLDGDGQSGTP
jgi:hypothetical protein